MTASNDGEEHRVSIFRRSFIKIRYSFQAQRDTSKKYSCEFCNEPFSNSGDLGAHLYTCGNKTDQCPLCQRYIRRAVFHYHVSNDCVDIDEEYTIGRSLNKGKFSFCKGRISQVIFINRHL